MNDVNTDHKHRIAISKLIGHNVSLRDREIEEELKSTDEYMELIRQFNIAFEELQARKV